MEVEPTPPAPPAPPLEVELEPVACTTIAATAAATPDLSALLELATVAGIVEALEDPTVQYTVLAPSNEAVAELGPEALADLASRPEVLQDVRPPPRACLPGLCLRSTSSVHHEVRLRSDALWGLPLATSTQFSNHTLEAQVEMPCRGAHSSGDLAMTQPRVSLMINLLSELSCVFHAVQLLFLHVIPGVFRFADLFDGMEVTTLSNQVLTIFIIGENRVIFAPQEGTAAAITLADLSLIHI